MALVHSKLKGEEEERYVDCLILSHLDDFKFASIRIWNKLS